ncbi:MAG: 50S ribosomal protein L14e [Candidatus Nanoarchaeia archaeon]
MMEVGRLCLKVAGRDAGKKCVIVDVIGDRFVMIDGETRRRKCNIAHLEPLRETMNVKKGAVHADVLKEFSKYGIDIKVSKPKKAGKRPSQIRAAERKKAAEETKKEAKPAEKNLVEKKPAGQKEVKPIAENKDKPAEKETEKKK